MRRRKKNRNRKKDAQGFVFPAPLALFLAMVTVVSITYLWLYGRCEASGMRIQQLEREQRQVRQRLLDEELRWSQRTSMASIRAAVSRHGLDMALAPNNRVVHLPRPETGSFVLPYGELARLHQP